MRVSPQWKITEVVKSCATACFVDLARRRIATNDLRHFYVKEMGRVQRLTRTEQALFSSLGSRRA